MARFNELLASRYAEGLTALLGLSEQEGITTVAPELMTVVVAESDRTELSYLKQERRCWGSGAAAADAAQFSYVTLINPADSGILVTCESIVVDSSVANLFDIGWINAAAFATLSALSSASYVARDGRWGILNGNVAGQLRNGSGTGGAIQISVNHRVRMPANESRPVYMGEVVIPPGQGIGVTANAINVAVGASFAWRERKFLPEESAS